MKSIIAVSLTFIIVLAGTQSRAESDSVCRKADDSVEMGLESLFEQELESVDQRLVEQEQARGRVIASPY